VVHQWQQEFQQIAFDPKYGKLAELAQQYHAECDAFDAGVCTGTYNGSPFPANSWERSQTSKNAKTVFAAKLFSALELGCTEKEFQDALIEWADRPRSKA
jgi:hypothetical protein